MEDARSGSVPPSGHPSLAQPEAAGLVRSETKPAGGLRSVTGRIARHAPSVLVAVPVVWAVCAYASGSVPRPMAPEPRRPALAFTQHVVDLGAARPSMEVFTPFRFTNRGKRPVEIRKIEPSCACLKIEWQETRKKEKKTLYAPGESGRFLVRLETANQTPGPKEFVVEVEYEDPEPQRALVTFRVVLPDDKVSVYPPAIELAYFGTTSETVRDIEIVDRRPTPFSVKNVECSRKGLIGIGPVESEVDDLGYTHFRFQVTIPGDLPESQFAAIGIYTDDPDFRLLRVPLHIRNMGRVATRPRTIVDPRVQPTGATSEEKVEVEE